jgi:hypothetical protein
LGGRKEENDCVFRLQTCLVCLEALPGLKASLFHSVIKIIKGDFLSGSGGRLCLKLPIFEQLPVFVCRLFWKVKVLDPVSVLSFIISKIRVKLFHALRTDSVTKFRLRTVPDIGFDLIPITFIIAYLFAGSTNG